MKSIVTPVDFSDISRNALSFAAELAKRASAKLIVVNVFQGSIDEAMKSKMKEIESSFNCETIFSQGDFISELKKNIIANKKPDLIVMGTKGANGLKKILLGSNTVNVIGKVNTPVLIIPEKAVFADFSKQGKNRVVLATDLELLLNERCVDILKEISLFIVNAKARVLSVRPKNTKLPELKKIERKFLLSIFNPEIESKSVTVFSDNIIEGINFYLDQKPDCGLVAMIANDTGSLFEKHYTKEMAAHTNLPLLILHDVKV